MRQLVFASWDVARSAVVSLLSLGIATAAKAETWTCRYPGFGANREPVTVSFVVKNDKLTSARFGVPEYRLLENNQYSLIGVEHYSQFDKMKGAVRIYSATVIIDKTFGRFIYTVGEIGDEPGYAKGECSKD
jgi:hypothetical protein